MELNKYTIKVWKNSFCENFCGRTRNSSACTRKNCRVYRLKLEDAKKMKMSELIGPSPWAEKISRRKERAVYGSSYMRFLGQQHETRTGGER